MKPFLGVTQWQCGETRFVVDDRYYPYWFILEYGPGNADTLRLIYQLRKPITDYAHRRGEKVVTIFDISLMPPPDALSRKGVSELAQVGETAPGLAKTITVMSKNPLMRGVVTAIVWIAGDKLSLGTAPSMSAAIKEAARLLEGVPPSVPDGYEIPEWSDNVSTTKVSVKEILWSVDDINKV